MNSKILEGILVTFAVAVGIVVALGDLPVDVDKYSCEGTFTHDGIEEVGTLRLRLDYIPGWRSLWTDFDAVVWIETSSSQLVSGEATQSPVDFQLSKDGKHMGVFSIANSKLTIDSVSGVFEGECREVNFKDA